MTSDLSVIMPAYNEQDSIELAILDIEKHVFNVVPNAELVVVNDGSKDDTGKILDQLGKSRPFLKVIHQSNGGHGDALLNGIAQSCGRKLFLIDSDRQIGLEGFEGMWRLADQADAVIGMRSVRKDPRIRLVITVMLRFTLRVCFRVKLFDANIPCKILSREIWEQAATLIPRDSIAPSIFLAVFASRMGFRVVEIPVTHFARTTGTVSIRRWKLIKFCWRGLRQLVAFRSALTSKIDSCRRIAREPELDERKLNSR